MQKARSHPVKGLLPFVSVRFQVLFHSSVRSAFHLSFTVLVHYRSLRSIQPYQMVLADSHRISPVPRYSGYYQVIILFHVRDYHPLWSNFPDGSTTKLYSTTQSYNPSFAVTKLVWACPRSLATTQGITLVFFSSRYLDVSVPWVSFHKWMTGLQPAGLPHSEISGSKVVCTFPKLFAACHVLHRL